MLFWAGTEKSAEINLTWILFVEGTFGLSPLHPTHLCLAMWPWDRSQEDVPGFFGPQFLLSTVNGHKVPWGPGSPHCLALQPVPTMNCASHKHPLLCAFLLFQLLSILPPLP